MALMAERLNISSNECTTRYEGYSIDMADLSGVTEEGDEENEQFQNAMAGFCEMVSPAIR